MKRVVLLLCLAPFAFAQDIDLPHTLSNNSVANADQVMANFNALKDGVNSRISVDLTNYNVVLGDGLQSVTPGTPNSFNGKYNTAIGSRALYSNTTGHGNTASGFWALFNNTTGHHNTAIGSYALVSNTTGYWNTASGDSALENNTTGHGNTASGISALAFNTTGYGNTASGISALTRNTTGYRNTSSGEYALRSNTTGFDNTAIGSRALYSNTTGYHNTASGVFALTSNTTGYWNTALGYKSLWSNQTGWRNTAIGWQSLWKNTGINNTAVGADALYSHTTGEGNTALGNKALDTNTTGRFNTAVGHNADVGSASLENATAIGFYAVVDASNKVRIGNTDVTVIQGQVPFTSSSDARLKDSITPVSDGLALINDLNPVSYHRTNNPESDIEMGLLAQEVEATLEKHGLGNSGMVHQPTEEAYMSLRYNDLLAPMIRAMQELDDALEAKDEQIVLLGQKLEAQQDELLAIVQSQQEQIAQLQRMAEHQFAAR